MTRFMKATIGAAIAISGMIAVGAPAVGVAAGASSACSATAGVTVIVDFTHFSGGKIERGCAAGHPANALALHAAGFTTAGTAQYGDAFLCRIDGLPTPAGMRAPSRRRPLRTGPSGTPDRRTRAGPTRAWVSSTIDRRSAASRRSRSAATRNRASRRGGAASSSADHARDHAASPADDLTAHPAADLAADRAAGRPRLEPRRSRPRRRNPLRPSRRTRPPRSRRRRLRRRRRRPRCGGRPASPGPRRRRRHRASSTARPPDRHRTRARDHRSPRS